MRHWLLKSEPTAYSWDQLVRDGATSWTGVRNHQAASNLKAMRVGDRGFFYHSNEGREIVGLIEIVKPAYRDPTDKTGSFVAVDVKPLAPVKTSVTLAAIKALPKLKGMALLRQGRLSVSEVTHAEWAIIAGLAGLTP
jgi:predicted RNA-binding protein with PUA-like domain